MLNLRETPITVLRPTPSPLTSSRRRRSGDRSTDGGSAVERAILWQSTRSTKAFVCGAVEMRHVRIVRTCLSKTASDHLPLVIDFHMMP